MTQAPLVEPASAWLAAHVPGARPLFAFDPVPGGSSNPTFYVTDAAGRRWVLRRPPAGGVLPSAHDMGREFRVLSALHRAGFPVPEPVAFCQQSDVLGAPFYVMRRVEGLVLRSLADVGSLLEPSARRTAAAGLVATLARLHALDPDAIGLGDFGRREGYIARQLRRWSSQAEGSAAASGVPQPGLAAMHDRLAESLPEGGPTGIVHGDFRLGNVVVAPDGRLRAVLDWELCTLGATLADAAHLLLSWIEYPQPLPARLPSPREMAAAYLERAGASAADRDYHLAFAAWRLGCILAGVHARYAAGVGAGDRVDLGVHLKRIDSLVGIAERALEGGALELAVASAP